MTRSTSAALDWPATRPRPSKLAQPAAAATATSTNAMQVLETDPNADPSTTTKDAKAAARMRFIDDIHLAHHAVHGHLDGERDRDPGIAEAAHVPAPDIALHFFEVLHLVRRPEEVAPLLGARHEGLAAVGLARVVEPGLAARSGALLGRGAHDLLDVLGARLTRREVIAVERGASRDEQHSDWNDREQGAHARIIFLPTAEP